MRQYVKNFILITCCIGIISCSWWNKDKDDMSPYQQMTPEELYKSAQESLQKEQYKSAVKKLEAMETLYPFSDKAPKAQRDLIYAYYKDSDYPSSAAAADRFIHLYPRDSHVDYAYYMKGLANFQQPRGALAGMLSIDESWRDPGTQAESYTDFSVFVDNFKDSKYRDNALQRMIYLRNDFAEHELNVANYYYERQMYVAAIERAAYVVKNYPQAPSTKAALALINNANQALGFTQAATDATTVYKATFKNNNVGV